MAAEKKNPARSRILNYILSHQTTSKAELAKELSLSMPTVLANVNALLANGIVTEQGEYESTGGRKAKSIGVNKEYAYSIGVIISANHLEMVLLNLGYEIERIQRLRLKFSPDIEYCREAAQRIEAFIQEDTVPKNILGVGIAIPGIIDVERHIVTKSHALNLENYSLNFLEQTFRLPVHFENDANAAMLAENQLEAESALYISLNHTLGGAFSINGHLFRGENEKAGEFGHMILVPNGRKCYCGKAGCADAYCAASVLTNNREITLDAFMQKLQQGNKAACAKWEEYLNHLAILIANLRMAYDMDIILGGEVGGILAEYMMPLSQKVMQYNGFDHDVSYLKLCSYSKGASAVGVAKHFFMQLVTHEV